jgi:hypothetical protein
MEITGAVLKSLLQSLRPPGPDTNFFYWMKKHFGGQSLKIDNE